MASSSADGGGGGGGGDDDPSRSITISIKASLGGNETITRFKVKRSTKLSKVFQVWLAKAGIERKAVRFLFEGEVVADDDSAEKCNLKDGAEIHVVMEQIGGA